MTGCPSEALEQREAVAAIIQSLPRPCRDVAWLVGVDGLTQAATARRLGLSQTEVSRRLRLARTFLEPRP